MISHVAVRMAGLDAIAKLILMKFVEVNILRLKKFIIFNLSVKQAF